eukprot:3420365-Prymnesium_polylepis.1
MPVGFVKSCFPSPSRPAGSRMTPHSLGWACDAAEGAGRRRSRRTVSQRACGRSTRAPRARAS